MDPGSNPGVYNYGASGISADGQLLDPQLFYSTTPTPEILGFVPSSTPLPIGEVQQYQVTPITPFPGKAKLLEYPAMLQLIGRQKGTRADLVCPFGTIAHVLSGLYFLGNCFYI